MMFVLGLISGIAVSILIFTVLAFFRAGIEKRVRIIETTLGNAGPKPTGAIFVPEDEATLHRNEILRRNKEAGKDTPISELQ